MRDHTPSQTALLVAYLVLLSVKKRRLRLIDSDIRIQAEDRDAASAIVTAQAAMLSAAGLLLGTPQQWANHRLDIVTPTEILLRKCYIENHVRRLLPLVKQVLVLGAGYDTLAHRLAGEFPHWTFYEVDHPATSKVKLRALQRLIRNDPLSPQDRSKSLAVAVSVLIRKVFWVILVRASKLLLNLLSFGLLLREPPVSKPSGDPVACTTVLPNLHLVSLDLSQLDTGEEPARLGEVLHNVTNGQYSPSAPTIIVMEGLSMYLTKEQLQHLLQNHLIPIPTEDKTDKGAGQLVPRLLRECVSSVSPDESSQYLVLDVLAWNDATNTPDVGRYSWHVVNLVAWLAGERMHFGVSHPVLLNMSHLLSGDPHHGSAPAVSGPLQVTRTSNENRRDSFCTGDHDQGQWRVIADTYQCFGREHLMVLEFIFTDKKKGDAVNSP
jgi:Leucine carboxyl methyltransferase